MRSVHLVDDEHAAAQLKAAVEHAPQEHLADALLQAVAHLVRVRARGRGRVRVRVRVHIISCLCPSSGSSTPG